MSYPSHEPDPGHPTGAPGQGPAVEPPTEPIGPPGGYPGQTAPPYAGQPGPAYPPPTQPIEYAGQPGPVSGPPTQPIEYGAQPGPASGPPYPGQFSAPPAGSPMSGPPGIGVPYGGAPTARADRKVLVLAVVAGLLLLFGGVMTTLYIGKSGDLTRSEKLVADRDTKIDANGKEIEGLKRDLQAANDKIKSIEQDLTGTQNDRDEQKRQKEVISHCLDLLDKAFASETRTEFDKNIKAADKACKEADKYL